MALPETFYFRVDPITGSTYDIRTQTPAVDIERANALERLREAHAAYCGQRDLILDDYDNGVIDADTAMSAVSDAYRAVRSARGKCKELGVSASKFKGTTKYESDRVLTREHTDEPEQQPEPSALDLIIEQQRQRRPYTYR